jgi:hypothetical protein
MATIYQGILLRNKKKQNLVICRKMSETEDHHNQDHKAKYYIFLSHLWNLDINYADENNNNNNGI